MFELENLLVAYKSCRKNKRNSINALEYELDYEKNLLELSKKLKNRTYECGRSICFSVKYPKLREVFASEFEDRVIHHLLVLKMESKFEKTFSHSSFACRKGKGMLVASKYLKKMMLKITKNKTRSAYYGQFDIKSFFMSIDKEILLEILLRKIKKEFRNTDELIWLVEKVVNHDPTKNVLFKSSKSFLSEIPVGKSLFKIAKGKGLSIGNLTSQFFANVYLNELDQYLKRELKVKNYVRYVDDMVLLSENREDLILWREKINEFLKSRLKLELQPTKDKFGSVYSGIDFVGYVTKPTYSLSRNRVVKNLKNKLYYFNQGYMISTKNSQQEVLPISLPPDSVSIERMLCIVNSYYGHLIHSSTYGLRKKLFEKNFGILRGYLCPVNDYKFFAFPV
jgi:RNA-directed DNA polymerase